MHVYELPSVSEGIELLNTLMLADDVVLIKGSHGSGVWRLADALKEIDR